MVARDKGGSAMGADGAAVGRAGYSDERSLPAAVDDTAVVGEGVAHDDRAAAAARAQATRARMLLA
jgi:hypothetical protein